MNFKQIQQLIKFVSKTDVNEVTIENKDFKINIKGRSFSNDTAQPLIQQSLPSPQIQPPIIVPDPAPVVQAPPQPTTTDSDLSNHVTIKSPIIGTFYRKPSPDKDNFVNVGDEISEGQTLCVIEAMKLFNEIESDVSGKIVKILVEDASPVEFDQPLFVIEPN
ncbi:MAG: acetyl-CoA carboxylase, biotin carboxyl carrier protein [Flavobacteriaceae bacterium]|nr:acetyl-CoA carboxylase, biotin carboxyl carrier protein [Flavobacteriaceae bacterium]|tara:strand:+ start:186 stop:674 length:489 start_codon:yes stop_codon:yes gene_type:complete